MSKIIEDEIKKSNPTDGAMNTEDVLYFVENQFKQELSDSLGTVRLNSGDKEKTVVKVEQDIPNKKDPKDKKEKGKEKKKPLKKVKKKSRNDENDIEQEIQQIGSVAESTIPQPAIEHPIHEEVKESSAYTEDIVQETFLHVWLSRKFIRTISRISRA